MFFSCIFVLSITKKQTIMGYYTSYSLEVDKNSELIEKFREESENARHAIDEDGGCGESCKWYSHEEELVNFSKKNAGVLFTLSGEGEESGDIWKKYIKNGVSQLAQAKVVVPEVDLSAFPEILPTKVKMKLTIEVEVESSVYIDNPDMIVEEWTIETDYNFSDTENVRVLNTEYLDTEVVR